MADLTVTAASVVKGSNSQNVTGVAGETITAGQVVYKDATTLKWLKADNDSATAAAKTAGGIALNGASLNQPLVVHTAGDITIGATLVAGSPYYLSSTAGGIMPAADLGTGDYVCLIGLAKSTTVLAVDISTPGVTL